MITLPCTTQYVVVGAGTATASTVTDVPPKVTYVATEKDIPYPDEDVISVPLKKRLLRASTKCKKCSTKKASQKRSGKSLNSKAGAVSKKKGKEKEKAKYKIKGSVI